MIQIHPDIIDQLEEWVRSDSRHSLTLEPMPGGGWWRLMLQLTLMPPGQSVIHQWQLVMIGGERRDLASEVQAAIQTLAARTPPRVQLPTSDQQYDWLYAWPSHRIERSNRLMLHMMEHDKPWTGRYLSD